MKQPDRFEQLVERVTGYRTGSFMNQQVASILRREHRAVVRLVQQIRRETNGPTCDYDNGVEEACCALLDKLRKRVK